MSGAFKQYLDQLSVLMEQLKNSALVPTDNLETVPLKGIYAFYERGEPLYVGRSDNVKSRIQGHRRPSSGHGSATFAFILAKEDAEAENINTKIPRKELEKHPRFKELYLKAKARVSSMQIRTVQVDDAILQTLFEVYAAVELPTKYNVFDNH